MYNCFASLVNGTILYSCCIVGFMQCLFHKLCVNFVYCKLRQYIFVYMNWHKKFSAYVIDEVTKPKQQLNFIVVLSKHFGLIFQFEIIT